MHLDARACLAVRARTPLAASCASGLRQGREGCRLSPSGQTREKGLTKKLDYGLIHRIMEDVFTKCLTDEPTKETLCPLLLGIDLQTKRNKFTEVCQSILTIVRNAFFYPMPMQGYFMNKSSSPRSNGG
jgi:hypothetical protein